MRFIFKYYFMAFILSLAACGEPKTTVIPPIESANRIKIEGIYLKDELEIVDPDVIAKVLLFIQSYSSGWETPWFGTPVAKVRLSLYNGKAFVGNIGVSHNFITRTYGATYSQHVDKDILMKFSKDVHQAMYEGAFEILPEDYDLDKAINFYKQRMKYLDMGSSVSEVHQFIKDNDFEITYESSTRINVSLKKIHTGIYADTVIAGQYVLNEETRLTDIRFFGLEIREKNF